jgi:hypothetical protein
MSNSTDLLSEIFSTMDKYKEVNHKRQFNVEVIKDLY